MVAFDTQGLLRRAIYEVEEYTPSLSLDLLSERLGLPTERIVKLDANENPYGPSPKVQEALAAYGYYHLYPDSRQNRLREAIQRYLAVDKAHIMAGNGSDELIDLVMRLLLDPGDAVILCPPSFGMYGFYATVNGAKVVEVPRRADFSLDVEGVERAARGGAKLLFLASPHNPSGCLTPRGDILRLLELPLVIVVDEAYAEFSGESVVDLVPKHPNLIVLRTFSKWAGLAGLRVGYGIFPLDIIEHLWKIKPPDNVNAAGEAAALASLDDLEYLRKNVRRIVAERERLYEGLKAIPYLRPYPSRANFILCQVVGRDVWALKEVLEREGIILRYFKEPRLQGFIRISVGKPEHTDALLAALRKFVRRVDNPSTASNEMRKGIVERETRETRVRVELDLDGTGKADIATGVGVLDHLLSHLALHGLLDLKVRAQGDLEVDEHHTVEDVAICLGMALDEALGEREGIVRMAHSYVPMDEALAFVALDLGGRAYAVVEADFAAPRIGALATSLIPHFLETLAYHARMNLHARVLYGRDDHHKAEALFKALGRALGAATRIEPRREGVPSTKGVLD